VLVPLTGSWRLGTLVCSGVPILTTVLWLTLVRSGDLAGQVHSHSTRAGMVATLSELARLRNTKLLIVGATAYFTVTHALNNWLPTMLDYRSFTASQAGFWAAASMAVGLLSPLLLSLSRSRSDGRRRYLVAALNTITAAAIVSMILSSGTVLIAAALVTGLTRSATMPLMLLLLIETPGIDARYTGAAAGLFFMFGQLGGFGGPFLFGLLKSTGGTFSLPLGVLASLSLLVTVIALTLTETRYARASVPAVADVG
jgi:cyanate permease